MGPFNSGRGSVRTAKIASVTLSRLSPEKGTRPAISVYRTMPAEYRSASDGRLRFGAGSRLQQLGRNEAQIGQGHILRVPEARRDPGSGHPPSETGSGQIQCAINLAFAVRRSKGLEKAVARSTARSGEASSSDREADEACIRSSAHLPAPEMTGTFRTHKRTLFHVVPAFIVP